jgi:putative ABC transport system permease protein
MYRLTSRPLGFDPSQLAVVSTTFTGDPTGGVGRELMQRIRAGGMDPIEAGRLRSEALLTGRARVADAAVNRLAAMPSVISAAAVSEVPFATAPVYTVSRFEGRPDTEQVRVQRQIVNESYFETMRLRVMRGRVFQIQDRQGAPVAVVSREFERRHLNGNALGRRLKLGPPPTSPRAVQRVHEVIGVVDDVKHREFADEDQATIYVFNWHGGDVRHLLVRSSGEMSTLVPQLRRVLREHDPRLVVTLATSMEGLVADSVAEERLRAALSAMFGGTALLLSAMGLYGLAARRVIDRRREIGVRMALGAEPGHVRRLVLRDSLSMAAFGLAIGLPAAYFASRVGQAFLYGVSATSPHIFISAGAILALAAMTAAFFPALRAGRIDPSIALRDQP